MRYACIRCGECCKKERGCLYGGLELPCEYLTKVDGVYACSCVLDADSPEEVMDDLGIGEGCCQPTLRHRKESDGKEEAAYRSSGE